MSKTLSEEILGPIKELITEITEFTEGSEPFNRVLKNFTTKLKKSDTMYFLNKRDVDESIDSMSEKFCFHGFFREADALKNAYKVYISENLQKSQTMARCNVVKFLLCMSECPTKHFLENPELFVPEVVEKEEEIDWAEYLNEGIEKWNPNYNDSSDEESFNGSNENECKELSNSTYSDTLAPTIIQSNEKMCLMDLRTSREELLTTVQHTWFHQEKFFMKPESSWREANIGILWEEYLREQVKGLIMLKTPSFISEYKVIREILWQLWSPHTSCTIELNGNTIRPKSNITIPSVRYPAFFNFMYEFIPYIELLEYFREFEKSLGHEFDKNDFGLCRTYQSYCSSQNSIIYPIYKKLCAVEDEVRKQETTYTLLKLAEELSKIFEPLKILKAIHDDVIISPRSNSSLTCATTLIKKLHESLHFTTNKLEQDLKVALFLNSVYHYFDLVDSWLIKDDLTDYTAEFLIEKKINTDRWLVSFHIRDDIEESCKENSFLKIFLEKVLKIGRNITFLRLLGKYDIVGDCQESLYDEFVKKVFKKLESFYDIVVSDDTTEHTNSDLICESEANYIFPVLGPEVCTNNPEIEKLENLIDTRDGFLMTAFADYFLIKTAKKENKKPNLFERISNTTKNLFPKTNFFESIFLDILEERFTISGLMVKNFLIEEHLLEKQFQFLRHLYFFDDMIFPFYRRFFEKTESTNKNWANDIWLTFHLHDIFMDMYPELYEKCSVQVKGDWSLCTDSLSACSLVHINYEISWPLNILITKEQVEMYREIFQFLIKLKWALHTLNHLMFSDLEFKEKSSKKTQKTFKSTHHKHKATAKLIRLKFCLINILNSLQHFVFGFVLSKNVLKFELEFEKAYDLESLVESHREFIFSVFKDVMNLQKYMIDKDKLNNVLKCIKLLKLMWSNVSFVNEERINDCNKIYETFYCGIEPVIFPVYIYDY